MDAQALGGAVIDGDEAQAQARHRRRACPIGGGIFADAFMTRGPLDRLLPVDVYVPGSPPNPLALLHGLLLAAGKADERLRVMESA